MGRSLAFTVLVIGAVIAIALIDRGRETEPLATVLGTGPAPSGEEAGSDDLGSGFGGPLVECLSGVAPPASAPASPPLTPRGVDAIAARVERLRELRFDGPVEVRFLSASEIGREVSAEIEDERDQRLFRRAGEYYALLGAIPEDADLFDLLGDALDSQVLGLYVPETGELLAVTSGEAGAIEAITVAHELDHALTDEALGLPLPDRARRGRGDRDYAALSLVEGDATLLMSLYAVRYIGAEEQLELLDDPSLNTGGDGFDELPYLIQAQLLFPYEAGLEYVCELYAEGGWEAVDAAYESPPRSTAELLDPGTARIATVTPPPLPRLGPPWSRVITEQIGAAELSWLFAAPGDDTAAAIPEPELAAADWRGGEVELWRDGGRRALGIALAQRTGGSLCEAMTAWWIAANPGAELAREGTTTTLTQPGVDAAISCEGDAIRMGISSDTRAALALTAAP